MQKRKSNPRSKRASPALPGSLKNERRGREPARRIEKKSQLLRFVSLSADRWSDLETLFGERGACGGCWCMAWRLPRKEFDAGKGPGNRSAFRKIVTQGDAPGVLALVGDEPVGWCAVAPRQTYVALERSRVLKPLDNQPVWSVSCFFVRKDRRRAGLGTQLLSAAVDFAGKRGAKIVEGYPIIPHSENVPAPFAWTGTVELFEKAGFTKAGAHSKARPIMRIAVQS